MGDWPVKLKSGHQHKAGLYVRSSTEDRTRTGRRRVARVRGDGFREAESPRGGGSGTAAEDSHAGSSPTGPRRRGGAGSRLSDPGASWGLRPPSRAASHRPANGVRGRRRGTLPDVAVILQRLAPDLAAFLWRVHELCELPLDGRGQIADVLVCEAAERGPDEDEEPNAYGRELGELFDALCL